MPHNANSHQSPAQSQTAQGMTTPKRKISTSTRNQIWLTGLFIALLVLFMSTASRAFLSWTMYESLLSTIPLYGFVALGLTLVVASGEMDLCFPSTMAMSGFAFAMVVTHSGLVWLGMLAAMLTGFLIGAGNGLIISYIGVPSIIATIGTQFFWRGVVMLLSQGLAIGLADNTHGLTRALFVGRLGDALPMQAVWLVFLAIALWLVLNRHQLGDAIRFTGENADTASRLGINVYISRFAVHTLIGTITGFAGAVGCLEMGSWWPTQGEGYMLLVFAAVFIGGTSVFGGSGRLYGTLIGIAIVGMIEAGIISSGLSGFWTRAVHGMIIIIAVSSYAVLSGTSHHAIIQRFTWKKPAS
ncbi:MAG: ABC transporter permease [Pseudomonadota bacterium]